MPAPAPRLHPPMAAYIRPPAPVAPRESFGQRLPWILVGALCVAVLALVAYIVWA
jgi:hypothetical protein